MTVLDWFAWAGPVVKPWVEAFATAFIPVAGTLAGVWLRKRGLNADVIGAAERAAGEGYQAMLKSGHPLNSKAALAIGNAAAAGYLATMLPGKIAAVNLSPEGVANLAGAQLGRLLGVQATTPQQ